MCRSCLSWYGSRIAPYLVHAGCSMNAFARMRDRMIPLAEGIVVEVGFGSGLNLPYYDATRVKRLVGIDPDRTMLALAGPQSHSLPFDVERIRASGESMPLTDGFADTVVVTYALCTIPKPEAALAEIRRILKPAGRLVFIEHGEAEAPRCRKWQARLNRPWGWLAGGCHLNRNPLHLIRGAGFGLSDVTCGRFPLPLWQLGSHYTGVAAPSTSEWASATRPDGCSNQSPRLFLEKHRWPAWPL